MDACAIDGPCMVRPSSIHNIPAHFTAAVRLHAFYVIACFDSTLYLMSLQGMRVGVRMYCGGVALSAEMYTDALAMPSDSWFNSIGESPQGIVCDWSIELEIVWYSF